MDEVRLVLLNVSALCPRSDSRDGLPSGNLTEPPCRLCAVWSSPHWFPALHQSSAISEHLYSELVHFINLLVLPQWMKKSICLICFHLILLIAWLRMRTLKYIHLSNELKWSYCIMGNTMSLLDIICYPARSPVPEIGYIFLSYCPKRHHSFSQTLQIICNAIGHPL